VPAQIILISQQTENRAAQILRDLKFAALKLRTAVILSKRVKKLSATHNWQFPRRNNLP
jgi:hypothetical protein